jgi:hypothetical protein
MTASSETGADLKTIIAYIDYVDHSIISWAELFNGLNKLKSIGAINEKNKKIFLTKKFNAWWLKKYQTIRRFNVLKQVEEIDAYLDKTYSAIRDLHKNPEMSLIEEDDFLQAIKEYKQLSTKS